jgi:hypothetical protein
MVNFLEQLVAEWYEFNGYFVQRNVRVGRRKRGGWESELDIVAFHPSKRHLVHIEPSSDTYSWEKRDERYSKKFAAGRRHIPALFVGLPLPSKIQQIAIFIFGNRERRTIAGGKIVMIADLMQEIRNKLLKYPVLSKAVPEQYTILRSLQFAADYWTREDAESWQQRHVVPPTIPNNPNALSTPLKKLKPMRPSVGPKKRLKK